MALSDFSLKDKTILVTGASSGLGARTAIECSKAGAHVIALGRNLERLNDTLSKMDGDGNRVCSIDLCDTKSLSSLCGDLPVLDGISLCAGITKSIPAKNVKEEDVRSMFETNIISSILFIKALLKSKKIAKGASIVFISSIATSYAAMGNSVYAATKGAVNSYAKVLALELAPRGIRVNVIQPGIIPTNMLSDSFSKEQFDAEASKYPLGFGEPVDIANGMIFLLSNASKWMTGSIINIDGGVTLL